MPIPPLPWDTEIAGKWSKFQITMLKTYTSLPPPPLRGGMEEEAEDGAEKMWLNDRKEVFTPMHGGTQLQDKTKYTEIQGFGVKKCWDKCMGGKSRWNGRGKKCHDKCMR